MNFFYADFDNNENKIFTLVYSFRNDVAVLNKFDANGLSILTLIWVGRGDFIHLLVFI